MIVTLSSCRSSPEIDHQRLETAEAYNIKKVNTFYKDEYGDQEGRDGELVGYAVFGNDGSLLNIKTTNSRQNMFQSNAPWIRRYSGIPVNRLLWVLDGGAYGQRWRNVNPFLTRGAEYPFIMAREYAESARVEQNRYADNKVKFPKQPWEYRFQIDNPAQPGMIETYAKRPVTGIPEMISTKTQRFEYDEKGRVTQMEVSQTHSIEGWPAQNYSESYQYDKKGRLSLYQRGALVVKISRNSTDHIDRVEVSREAEPLRWYTYKYLENGLRESSQAFNGTGALEFSIAYSYEFYD